MSVEGVCVMTVVEPTQSEEGHSVCVDCLSYLLGDVVLCEGIALD